MMHIIDFDNIQLTENIFIKPEYRNHEYISGNKMRKLKYHLEAFKSAKQSQILTFGGAFSNHIAAVAATGKEFSFPTIGVIRGEELASKINDNPTLKFATDCGMTLHFVSRAQYKQKSEEAFLEKLKQRFGDFYHIPEGGTSALAVKGCEEILTKADYDFDFICCSVGTGGTLVGIANSAQKHQKVLGFSALKGDFLSNEIAKMTNSENWELITEFHFGGYAKINKALVRFINEFKLKYNIQLDPIYTGKMLFGIFDLQEKGYFNNQTKVLAIHTGGLQGISGMNRVLTKKNLPLIE